LNRHLTALVALFLLAAAWGGSFIIVKQALRDITPETMMCVRFLLAAALLAPFVRRAEDTRRMIRHGLILGLLMLAGFWLQTRGLLYTTPSRSSFLTAVGITLVPLLESSLLRRRVTMTAVAGALMAVIGTAILVGPQSGPLNRGDLLTLAGAAAFAMHTVSASRFTELSPPITLAAIQVAFVGLAAIPFAHYERVQFTKYAVVAIIGLAIVNTAVAFAVLMWAQSRITATEAAIVLAFEPVSTAILSVLLGVEIIGAGLYVGGGLILAAMIVSQLGSNVKTETQATE
jgi:drug/metabolite transporter (DMT)-like permease